jgi:hypothetical protein
MPSLPTHALRRSARDPLYVVFLITVLLCLLRAPDLPRLDVGDAALGLPDVALLLLAVIVAVRLRATQLRALVSPLLVGAMAFAGLIVLSSIPNGTTALTAAVKLAELVVLTFACAALVDTEDGRDALATIVVGLAVVAATWAVVDFVRVGAGRQPSFLGEHDLAALGTMAMSVGFAAFHSRGVRLGAVAWIGLAAGALAVTLGAALASLLGLYLAVGTILLLAAWRRSLKPQRALATLALVALVTVGAVQLRSGDLGFLKSWFGPEPEQTGQYAASWSQRLIYSYIGGRIFLDNPAVGTGWYGELPPEEFARYLPEARERFSDQPLRYFPAADGLFTPQQTYDQVLYELGIVGGLLLLALLALAARQALLSALRWPRGPDSEWAYIPSAWLAALVGALAGAALFGGTPIAGIFWLTLGVVAAVRTPSPTE